MPVIIIEAFNDKKNLQGIDMTVRLRFKQDYHNSVKSKSMITQIEGELNELVAKYFDLSDIESEHMSNHEYNLHTKH